MNDTTITLVTGANKGIGREIAAQLAALGHTVVIGARSAELGEKAAAELRATGADVTSVVLDVTDPASAAAAAHAVEARHGRTPVSGRRRRWPPRRPGVAVAAGAPRRGR
ncbi:MAG TPA: SDR family NAD(P)-dependent oxidoreductase [Umezawaea sp.]|nr:SDR family NAD(P)-dependent oxidoreductase [Umezawaea sp.]